MDKFIMALGPAFIGSFAVQRFLEVVDPLTVKLFGAANKKAVLGLVSLAVGFILVFGAKLSILRPFGIVNAGVYDSIITGFVISVGSEGINSILKFLGYAKEDKKVEAAMRRAAATESAATSIKG